MMMMMMTMMTMTMMVFSAIVNITTIHRYHYSCERNKKRKGRHYGDNES